MGLKARLPVAPPPCPSCRSAERFPPAHGSLSSVATVNHLACRGLDKLEEKLPFLQQPSDVVLEMGRPWGGEGGEHLGESGVRGKLSHWPTASRVTPFLQVVTSAKDTVAKSVTGVVDLARRGRRWSGELRRSMSQAVDTVLGKSEELVDRFLPMTEAALGTDQRGLGLAQGCTAQRSLTQHREARSDFSLHDAPKKVRHCQPQRHWGFCT